MTKGNNHSPSNPHTAREKLRHELRSRLNIGQTWYDKLAEIMTNRFGTMSFLLLNAVLFAFWIIANLGFFPFIPVFDPYPFTFLTMIVSLEAIFLSIIVLISENQQNHIADIRQQMDLEINVRAEAEITKILRVLHALCAHNGLSLRNDRQLKEMEEDTNLAQIEQEIKDEKERGMG